MTAAMLALQGALDETEDSGTIIGLAVAGIVTIFCLWIYFDNQAIPRLNSRQGVLSLGLRALLRVCLGGRDECRTMRHLSLVGNGYHQSRGRPGYERSAPTAIR